MAVERFKKIPTFLPDVNCYSCRCVYENWLCLCALNFLSQTCQKILRAPTEKVTLCSQCNQDVVSLADPKEGQIAESHQSPWKQSINQEKPTLNYSCGDKSNSMSWLFLIYNYYKTIQGLISVHEILEICGVIHRDQVLYTFLWL